MPNCATVTVHESQFPENVESELLRSLRSGNVNHKFHYGSYQQTAKWLRLHEAYSPARTDPDCARIYEQSYTGLLPLLNSDKVHLIGLGCGGGQKDVHLLEILRQGHKTVTYSPVDVSVPMVLVARTAANRVIPHQSIYPVVCDLATSGDLVGLFGVGEPSLIRVLTFFGMMPNFEPDGILPRLAKLVAPGTALLISANLAPGPDYLDGIRKILPLYDNELTRDWLTTFLTDVGVEKGDGDIQFSIEEDPVRAELKRVTARFRFMRDRHIQVSGETLHFSTGCQLRLFFSCRYTPCLLRSHLAEHGLVVQSQWITTSQQEGVFLVVRPAPG